MQYFLKKKKKSYTRTVKNIPLYLSFTARFPMNYLSI